MAQNQNTHALDIFDGTRIYAPDQSGAHTCNQGNLGCFDSTLNGALGGVRDVASQADLAKFVGVAMQNSIVNSLNDLNLTVEYAFKNVFKFKTTSGDVYTDGAPVYFNETADAGTVTVGTNSGARTVIVGYVSIPGANLMNGILSVTGAAGTTVQVAVRANYPVAALA